MWTWAWGVELVLEVGTGLEAVLRVGLAGILPLACGT